MLRNKLVTLIQKQLTKAWHEGNLDAAVITEAIINKAVEPLLEEEGVVLITDVPSDESNGCIRVSGEMSATKINDDQWVLFHNGMTSFVTSDYVVGWAKGGSVPNTPAANTVEPTEEYILVNKGELPTKESPKYLFNSTEIYDQAVHDVGGDPLKDTPYADTDFIDLDTVWPEKTRYFQHRYTNVKWRLSNDVLERRWNDKWKPVNVNSIEDFLSDDNIEETTSGE